MTDEVIAMTELNEAGERMVDLSIVARDRKVGEATLPDRCRLVLADGLKPNKNQKKRKAEYEAAWQSLIKSIRLANYAVGLHDASDLIDAKVSTSSFSFSSIVVNQQYLAIPAAISW